MKRKRKITKHHNINQHNGGTSEIENIILLKEERHKAWHEIFKNRTFKQAAKLLLRVDRMKGGKP